MGVVFCLPPLSTVSGPHLYSGGSRSLCSSHSLTGDLPETYFLAGTGPEEREREREKERESGRDIKEDKGVE